MSDNELEMRIAKILAELKYLKEEVNEGKVDYWGKNVKDNIEEVIEILENT